MLSASCFPVSPHSAAPTPEHLTRKPRPREATLEKLQPQVAPSTQQLHEVRKEIEGDVRSTGHCPRGGAHGLQGVRGPLSRGQAPAGAHGGGHRGHGAGWATERTEGAREEARTDLGEKLHSGRVRGQSRPRGPARTSLLAVGESRLRSRLARRCWARLTQPLDATPRGGPWFRSVWGGKHGGDVRVAGQWWPTLSRG